MEGDAKQLICALYRALAAADEAALAEVLHPRFSARFAAGLPVGGGIASGAKDARDHWWAIGKAFAVRAQVEEIVACRDGRVLVVGTYRGRHRGDGHAVDARFVHLWGIAGDRLASLEQVTDTAKW